MCDLCGHGSREGWSFEFKIPSIEGAGRSGIIIKCPRCAAKHLPMLRRSLILALFVGTILTILNQGDAILSGAWTSALYWKVPLTYCVPFCVATYGALSNGRR